MNRLTTKISRLAFVVLLGARTSTLFSQSFTGMVSGVATDPQGAVLPEVNVTLVNESTNETRSQVTNETGNYTFPQLRPGLYRVEAELPGFKKFFRRQIAVNVQQQTVINIQLEIGSVTESVEVTGAVPLLQPDTSSLGQVVNNQQVAELPLVGRNTWV